MCFEDIQMPELFAGLPKERVRGAGALPHGQRAAGLGRGRRCCTWCAILLGLEPDMPAGRIYLDPALPAWCSRLELRRLRLGRHEVRVAVERRRDGRHVVEADAPGLEIVSGVPPWLEIAAD